MPIRTIIQGPRFRICAYEKGTSCETLEFLKDLENNQPADHKRILAIIKKTADSGPPRNIEQCNSLSGEHADDLYEFKTPGGVRLLWFYDKGRLIICSHGFLKKGQKTPRAQIDRAQSTRKQYFEEIGND